MNFFKRFPIPYLLAPFILSFVAFSLWYSHVLVTQLREEEKERIQLYGEILKFIATSGNECEVDFLFTHFIQPQSSQENKKNPLVSVPTIILNSDSQLVSMNLPIPTHKDTLSLIQDFLTNGEVLQVEFSPNQYLYIAYKESFILQMLNLYPYLIYFMALLFIGIYFYYLVLSQRQREDSLWNALAKETAHQLGTPISGLYGWIELLKEELKNHESPAVQSYLNGIEKELQKLSIITERFSKIGSVPEMKKTKIVPLLKEVMGYYQNRFGKRIRFSLESKVAEDTEVSMNPLLFSWVIENLLKNCIDAIEKEGAVTLRIFPKSPYLAIEVEDTGCGIPPELKRKIFKPGISTKTRGWGIGLSLAKRIIEDYHKGKIFLKWSQRGKGTCFQILLKP
jgi:signal transduction histidine kinase